MAEGTAEITRRGLARLRGGHPWIYKSDVVRLQGVGPGEVVRVVDGRGWFVGRAFYSQTSQITLRLLTLEDEPVDTDFFGGRIDRALELRRRFFGDDAGALRLVHGEADLLPGLVVDRYGDVVVVQTLTQGTDRMRETFFELLDDRLSPRAIVERNDAKVRSHEGLALRSVLVRGEDPGLVEFAEGGVTLTADPMGGQKTGGFLDQRENRIAVESYVRPGDRALDAFCYTGGFALHLARAGARVSAVETSAPALAEAAASAERNGLDIEWVEANAFDWLKEHAVEGDRFQLIVLDPPAFARSKKNLDAAFRGYKEVNLRALQMLAPGGILVTCSCSHHMSEDRLMSVVLDAANDAGCRVQLLERRGAGRDHPVLLGVPETGYLKTLFLRRVG